MASDTTTNGLSLKYRVILNTAQVLWASLVLVVHFILECSLLPSAGAVWLNVLRGPLEVLGGAVTGVVLGYFLHYFPSRDQVCEQQLYDCEVHVQFKN